MPKSPLIDGLVELHQTMLRRLMYYRAEACAAVPREGDGKVPLTVELNGIEPSTS